MAKQAKTPEVEVIAPGAVQAADAFWGQLTNKAKGLDPATAPKAAVTKAANKHNTARAVVAKPGPVTVTQVADDAKAYAPQHDAPQHQHAPGWPRCWAAVQGGHRRRCVDPD